MVQWQNICFPSKRRGFDYRYPHKMNSVNFVRVAVWEGVGKQEFPVEVRSDVITSQDLEHFCNQNAKGVQFL